MRKETKVCHADKSIATVSIASWQRVKINVLYRKNIF